MIREHRAKDGTRSYGVRVHRGGGRYEWIGTFRTRREARIAEGEALRRASLKSKPPTCGEFCDRWLADYERTRKDSTVDQARSALRVFLREHRATPIDRLDRPDCERFATERDWAVPTLVTCFNAAERQGAIERSPFKGLSRRRSTGRRDVEPLSICDVNDLADAALHAHRAYGPTMRAFVLFAAYTGLRPGEMYGLEWRDVDMDCGRVSVRRRVYRGRLDLPKSNKPRLVALLPQARDSLLELPRAADVVFPAKRGGRLSEPLMSGNYWPPIVAAFGRPVDRHELRHFCGHYLYVTMNLPARVAATQLGHSSPRKVEELYGHFKVGALEEIDRAFGANVAPIRRLQDARDAHG